MLYTIITISLVLLSTFVLLPKFKGFTENYNLSINYFLTLVATLVGVLLAIAITNHEAEKKEKQDVIKLIRASISSVETCHDYTEKLIEHYDQLPAESNEKQQFYAKNQPPYPEYLDAFLMQNIVSKNLSGDALGELNERIINLKRTREHRVPMYLSMLTETSKILSYELSFQRGEINEHQLEQKIDSLKL